MKSYRSFARNIMKMNPRILIVLAFICVASLLFNVIQKDNAPACFNADEAAFGYNSYSILKTGKDEYGTPAPLRLMSFGDYKLPLYAYLSVPFIAAGGLNESSARALNTALALLFPLVIFFLSRELFKNDSAALLAAAFTASSLGLATIARQAHEGYLAALLTATVFLLFLRWSRMKTYTALGFFLLAISLLLFSYQSARIFAAFFFACALFQTIRKRIPVSQMIVLFLAFVILALPDVIYKPARVGNLLFFKNPGLGLKTQELRQEGGNKLVYNKATVAATQFLGQHLSYYSPQFLAIRGDENFRFGFTDMPPLTYVEYALFLTGIYFLIRKKEKNRSILFWLLLITPIAGSLSWAGSSITRTLFLLPLIALISSYGFVELEKTIPKKRRVYVTSAFCIAFFVFLFYGWNFYLNHYNKRAAVQVAQQCGYRELGTIIKKEYPKTKTIYMTKAGGEPYIFMLFYLGFDPATYQKQAKLSAPDIYGFGQVEKFDKFIFSIPAEIPSNSIVVGTPEDFKTNPALKTLNPKKIHTIQTGITQNFLVYRP